MSSTAAAPKPGAARTSCFSIVADADPGVMPRVVALFAKRALIPSYWCCRVSGTELTVDLQMESLDGDTARYLAACFRQMPTVRTVLTSEKG
jgi:hypothetical protein